MKKIVVLALVFLFANSNLWAKGDAAAGKKIAESQCATCHSADGNSSINPEWPKLAGQHSSYTVKQLQAFKAGMLKNGDSYRENALMGPMAMNLSYQDMLNLGAYYEEQTITFGGVSKEVLEKGEQLYRFGDPERKIPACTGCHGPDGKGINLAKFPSLGGQHPTYTALQLKNFREGKRNNDPNGVMRGIAEKMTDAQIDVISQYLQGLH
ncbi:MAG: c-type cytochrome [Pseudomonadota bacterium]